MDFGLQICYHLIKSRSRTVRPQSAERCQGFRFCRLFKGSYRTCRKENIMKLIYAIVRNDNEDDVTTALSKAGFSITKLNTTGGFLRKGNVTLMIGTEDDKVDQAIGIIKNECGESQKITIDMPFISGVNMVNYATMPMQVAVGGATIFVTDVVRFEKF